MGKGINLERLAVKMAIECFEGCAAGRYAGSKGPRRGSYANASPIDISIFLKDRVYDCQVKTDRKYLSKKERLELIEYCEIYDHIPLIFDGTFWFCGKTPNEDEPI